ncbi:MAG: flippase-like domain-containing protein, partial [Gammaproteobacteria bacterium]|nr:flippase-like domain-containing protein [Gammaproteobacteria bacterium]
MTGSALTRSLKIAMSVALLAVIVWQLDALGDVGTALARAVPGLLALAFILMTADRLLMSFKWLLLLESRGLRLPLYRGFTIYCAAMIWGMFLPTTIGADALRAYLTARAGLDGYEVTASIVVERVVGFVAALLFGLFGLILLSRAGLVDQRFAIVWWAGGAMLAGALALMLVSFSGNAFEMLLRLVPRRLRIRRIIGKFRQFHGVYRGYGDERRALVVFFV